jgi:1,6-anhydro-N-acetylmuramate kinase
MSILKTAALAAAVLSGGLVAAEAQPYGWGHGYGHPGRGYHRPAPHVWVPPNVARKQLQLQERFVEKYGVQHHYRPRHHRPYYGGYGRPVHPYRHSPYGW